MDKHIVLAKPAFGVSTGEVFREIDSCPPEERPDSEALLAGLQLGNMGKVYRNMINVLESYTLKKYPVEQCCYGHLHGPVIRRRTEGERDGTLFSLISADYLGFIPKKICD